MRLVLIIVQKIFTKLASLQETICIFFNLMTMFCLVLLWLGEDGHNLRTKLWFSVPKSHWRQLNIKIRRGNQIEQINQRKLKMILSWVFISFVCILPFPKCNLIVLNLALISPTLLYFIAMQLNLKLKLRRAQLFHSIINNQNSYHNFKNKRLKWIPCPYQVTLNAKCGFIDVYEWYQLSAAIRYNFDKTATL